jgi:hypothetical protein
LAAGPAVVEDALDRGRVRGCVGRINGFSLEDSRAGFGGLPVAARGRDESRPAAAVGDPRGEGAGEVALGYAEPKDDLIVEYDEDVLRALDHESATDGDDDFAEWVP